MIEKSKFSNNFSNTLSNIPKEHLLFLRMLFVLNLIDVSPSDCLMVDLFSDTKYNFFDLTLSFKNNICKESISVNPKSTKITVNETLRKAIENLIFFIKSNNDNYYTISDQNYREPASNSFIDTTNLDRSYLDVDSLLSIKFDNLVGFSNDNKIENKQTQFHFNINDQYINKLDSILGRKSPKFNEIPQLDFFNNVTTIDLLKIHVLLESDFISLIKYDENTRLGQFECLDFESLEMETNYSNVILEYYKNKSFSKNLIIDFSNLDLIFNEKDENLRIYKISAYYKYLIEYKKIDIIIKLRELLRSNSIFRGISVREQFFIYKYQHKLDAIPYSNNTKEEIVNILNYILNYHYFNKTPYIPINIILYTDDNETVETITNIIGEFMWFFGYLPINTQYFKLLDVTSFDIHKLYSSNETNIGGVIILNIFNQLTNQSSISKENILNNLLYEIQKSGKKYCTFIYGVKNKISHFLNENVKSMFNIEIDFDYLNINQIYDILINKLEQITPVNEKEKNKLLKYINSTYDQSEIKDYEYIKKLYNNIILNMNTTFDINSKNCIKLEDIPDVYNTENLPETMKTLNNLIGLNEIKEQINDLVSLLKFYKKANIDIKNFNLHMIFKGNPRNW